ncbi:Retrovirus-related Pol polyprotein from transposon opus [Eumeta japonica]|uniref:Retrovirus-related Pol polyprotein from transposon opus n=1 Tax=Eumeta variegata TaxID=151549 RepID=A0A4C1T7M2_EUMVA|nr:Retrovirus-related Pol polyprotein from transposon opus [Eumeta japonica]
MVVSPERKYTEWTFKRQSTKDEINETLQGYALEIDRKLPDCVRDLQVFDGNPVKYISWIHSVESILKDYEIVKEKPIFRATLQHIRQKIRGPADALSRLPPEFNTLTSSDNNSQHSADEHASPLIPHCEAPINVFRNPLIFSEKVDSDHYENPNNGFQRSYIKMRKLEKAFLIKILKVRLISSIINGIKIPEKYLALLQEVYREHFSKFRIRITQSAFDSHLDFLPENLGAVSDEHGERFHQEMLYIERRYNGKSTEGMLEDFVGRYGGKLPLIV